METMHMMTDSICGGSLNWMFYATYLGFFGCGFFSVFHLSRMALAILQRSALDYKSEFGHAVMHLGMAYMFLPNLSYHIIPDIQVAIVFTYLALCYLLRLALQPGSKLSQAVEFLHATMCLGMAYSLLPDAWQQIPVLQSLFVVAYTAYGTIYAVALTDAFQRRRSERTTKVALATSIAYGISHIFMALSMTFMALMPSLMSMPMSMPMPM
jgi:hypothetical protein